MDACAREARFGNMTNFPLILTNFLLILTNFPLKKKPGRFSSSCVISAYYIHVPENTIDR